MSYRLIAIPLTLLIFLVSGSAASGRGDRDGRLGKRFVTCLELAAEESTGPLAPNLRTFEVDLAFERVRGFRQLGMPVYTVHGVWARVAQDLELVTLFEGSAALAPVGEDGEDVLEVNVESHELSIRRPEVFVEVAFHILLDPKTLDGVWSSKHERHDLDTAHLGEAALTFANHGTATSVRCRKDD